MINPYSLVSKYSARGYIRWLSEGVEPSKFLNAKSTFYLTLHLSATC
uniref:Uncharacterized protein n=1 Tax=Myoviridae sp. ctKZW4 TaxID=2826639 RepID=A0A8S5NAT5_9CAUD|nr:MAG TPA: hypothetical protein [Myoviridae sp. ctKZW4]